MNSQAEQPPREWNYINLRVPYATATTFGAKCPALVEGFEKQVEICQERSAILALARFLLYSVVLASLIKLSRFISEKLHKLLPMKLFSLAKPAHFFYLRHLLETVEKIFH